MLRGLYASASGMQVEARRLDVASNNLANAATAGYKRDTLVATPFGELLLHRLGQQGPARGTPAVGPLGLGTYPVATAARLRDGTLMATGRSLDVALVGQGLFAVRTPEGIRYTRHGSFTQRADGILATQDGHPVLVDGQPVGHPGAVVAIDDDGEVTVDGLPAGRLTVVTPGEAGPLRKVGASLWEPASGSGQLLFTPWPADDPRGSYQLRVGYLESSNVEPVLEMVNLIATMRSYEANQRALQAQESTLDRAVNDIGRV